jgi:hypothetical protein
LCQDPASNAKEGETMKKILIILSVVLFSTGILISAHHDLNSPNGGESWLLNSKKPITWDTTYPNLIRITLWQNGIKKGTVASNLDPTTGSYEWTVGEYQGGKAGIGGGYKIRIKGQDGGPMDESEDSFTIFGLTKAATKVFAKLKPDMRVHLEIFGQPIRKDTHFTFRATIYNSGKWKSSHDKYQLVIKYYYWGQNNPQKPSTPFNTWKSNFPIPSLDPKEKELYTSGATLDKEGKYSIWVKIRKKVGETNEESDTTNNTYEVVFDVGPKLGRVQERSGLSPVLFIKLLKNRGWTRNRIRGS